MFRPVALLVLVALAGCSGVIGPGGEAATVTPAPVQTPVETTTETSVLPPGVNGDGVVDAGRLARAHQRAITNRSYTWRASRLTTGNGSNATAVDSRQVARVQNETTYQYWTNHRIVWIDGRARNLGNYTAFADPTGRYVRYEDVASNTQYRRIGHQPARVRVGREAMSALELYLPAENATLAATRYDGQPYYELRGSGTREVVSARHTTNYTVRALIRPDGFVRSLGVRFQQGDAQSVRYTFTYESMGTTTVDRPQWVTSRWPRDGGTVPRNASGAGTTTSP